MLDGLILFAGLAGLWIGTEVLVSAAIDIASRLKLSQMFVGLTILAIGSDLPELVVAISASLRHYVGQDASGVLVGNALGSAIAQITLVVGIAGLTGYMQMGKRALLRDGMTLAGALAALLLFAADGSVQRWEGAILVVGYVVYLYTLLGTESRHEEIAVRSSRRLRIRVFHIVVGIVLVGVSSHYVVSSVLALAELWGVRQSLLGLLLVGLGTSLPELAIALAAIRKKVPAMSIGNLVGSNVFDTLVPVGVGALIYPVGVDRSSVLFDIPALALVTAIALGLFVRKKGLQRSEALALIFLYLIYAIVTLGYNLV